MGVAAILHHSHESRIWSLTSVLAVLASGWVLFSRREYTGSPIEAGVGGPLFLGSPPPSLPLGARIVSRASFFMVFVGVILLPPLRGLDLLVRGLRGLMPRGLLDPSVTLFTCMSTRYSNCFSRRE